VAKKLLLRYPLGNGFLGSTVIRNYKLGASWKKALKSEFEKKGK